VFASLAHAHAPNFLSSFLPSFLLPCPGNQVGVCNCKHCIVTKGTKPNHWCYQVGLLDDVVIDIDENGGNVRSTLTHNPSHASFKR
jgi:hypothetical protein